MSEIKLFVNPIKLTDDILSENFERKIFEYCNLLEDVKKDKIVCISSDFYESEICKNTTIADYVFGSIEGIPHDAGEYMMSIILDIVSEDESINELINKINKKENCKYKALIGHEENNNLIYPELYVDNISKIVNPIRYYIKLSSSLNEFKDLMLEAYPDVFFHKRVFNTMSVFKDIINHRHELNRHLSAINDRARKTYENCNNNSDEFYRVFGVENELIISGRGSNEGLDKFMCDFTNDIGAIESIRCNPHTKLYTRYSNYRIYFNLGRVDIEQGRVLIAHLGAHWE